MGDGDQRRGYSGGGSNFHGHGRHQYGGQQSAHRSYSGTVSITNTTNGNGDTTRPVALRVLAPGTLDASPSTGLVSSGLEGGPFSPGSIDYVLTNPGETDVNFHISGVQSWVSLDFVGSSQSSTTGPVIDFIHTIQPGGTKTVRASINANANSLAPSTYTDTLTFHHSSPSGRVSGNLSRPVSLENGSASCP